MTFPVLHPARFVARGRPLGALFFWRTLGAARRLARESVGTLQGRLMLLMSVVALPGFIGLLTTGGPLAAANLDETSVVGALFLGAVGLTLCLCAMVPVLVAKALVLIRDNDPVAAHPGFHPESAVSRVAVAVVGLSAFLALFFTLVHGSLLPGEGWSSSAPRLALFAFLTVQLVLPGALAAEATRRFLAGREAARRARAVHAVGAVLLPLLFPAFVWLPLLAHRASVDALASVGAWARGVLAVVPAVVVAAFLVAGLLGSGWVLGRWLAFGPAALCCPRDVPGPPVRSSTLPFAPRAEGRRSLVALFLWKDAFVAHTRRPYAYLAFHAALLAGTCLASTEVGHPESALVASAGLGALSLGALGREGAAADLVRPVLGSARMFGTKWMVGFVEASAPLPLYALAIGLATTDGPAPATLALAQVGIVAGIAFSLLATTLGFLLPDPKRRSVLIPGASRGGQALYAAVATLVIGGFL